MNFDRLHSFSVAAKELNFTRAARRLSLSQPAITQQIRELEAELDVMLFERRGRTVALTPAGERLKPLADAILRDVELAREALSEFRGSLQGVIRLGASETVGIYLLPYALGSFSRHFPGVRPSLQVADVDTVVRGLQEGGMDIAVIEHDLPPGTIFGWKKVPLLEDEIMLVAPPGHAWSDRTVALSELPQMPFIVRQADSYTRQLINDRLAEAGFDPRQLPVRFELGNTEGIKRAIMAGLGVGFASYYAVASELKAKTLCRVQLKDFRITRSIWLYRPAGRTSFVHQKHFCDLLLSPDWIPPFVRPTK